uniref:Uncharacterized protein n=1 Tax=Zooxanthella nutricula TaxID=1333877 RepID=A0A7S2QLL2_9DINO|mmetsp:Transcript_95594/g.292357  ORF Transcript_95594/g.292357 Transcript_95594/m.292357 type:complete len:250 (+) Transcript_95594:2-751(+)
MVGPLSASLAAGLDADSPLDGYAYFFLLAASFNAVLALAALMLRLPSPGAGAAEGAAPPWREVLGRTPVWTAVAAQFLVQFIRTLPMTAIPLAMSAHLPHVHAADLRISGCVVLHVLLMFLPGLWTGDLVACVGATPVMGAGIALQAGAMTTGILGQDSLHFYLSMALLAVGWNMAFVASTVMLLNSHGAAERTKVSSVNETLRFLATAVAAIVAASISWQAVCVLCLAALLPTAGVTLRHATGLAATF